ncbi:IS630 family transposase [Saccharolobus islandicus]|uniref:Resolvase helix-turn-helix domain protein n=1 Tax=Saccharolobus islandicus (strain M.14.25 / Kamchatka \|nr:IS630 family transposase [Sulfolobus islandicus]ACP37771.1 Resolvase helix-turn-helix domain protein [Sulfolobus islandicus M.14.25]
MLRTLKREIRKLISKKPKGLNETKARAILLHLEGMKISQIAKILQVHKSTVYRWVKEFEKEGEKCLFYKQRKGRNKKVNEREISIQELQGKTIWEAKAYIEEKFNVKISYSLENSEKEVKNSLHKTLQDRQEETNRCRLRERLKGVIKKGVKVFFMDECGIRHDPSRVRRLGLYVVKTDYPSVKVNVLACIPLFDGKPCFMLTYSNVDSRVFVNFLYLLRVRNSGNIVLIRDNAKFHKNAYVFSVASRLSITLLFLPPYSPDLNPIELVWKDLKRWVNTYHYSCYALEFIEDEFYYLVSKGNYTGYWIKKFHDVLEDLEEGISMEKFFSSLFSYLLTSFIKFYLTIIQAFLNVFLYFVLREVISPLKLL